MENDYLWNKTGEDKEIERLEEALRVFRYQENEPPVLPVAVVVNEPRFSIVSWRLAFAFGVILTLFFGGLAIWFGMQPGIEERLTVTAPAADVPPALPHLTPKEEAVPEPVTPRDKNKTVPKPRFIKTAFRPVEAAKNKSGQIKRKAKPDVQLTSEEKFAFNQLMLALSITGTQLKEVQAKVNGHEGNAPVTKSFR